MLERDKIRDVILVTGKTGHGKSRWAGEAIKSRFDRVLVLDPVEQYDVDYMPFSEIVEKSTSAPSSFFWGTSDIKAFRGMCRLAKAIGSCCILIEEIDLFDQEDEAFSDLVFRGRHSGVSMLVVTQRPYRCSIHFRSQMSELISFQQTEPRDIKWLKDISDSAIVVRDLQREQGVGSQFFKWSVETGSTAHRLDYKTGKIFNYDKINLSELSDRKNVLNEMIKKEYGKLF